MGGGMVKGLGWWGVGVGGRELVEVKGLGVVGRGSGGQGGRGGRVGGHASRGRGGGSQGVMGVKGGGQEVGDGKWWGQGGMVMG